MTTHSRRSSTSGDLIAFRNRFNLPLSRRAGDRRSSSSSRPTTAPRCATCTSSARRSGGYMPRRETALRRRCPCRRSRATRSSPLDAGGKEMSTTMAFVRMLGNLLKDTALGPRIVPIVADEARTFGMANLFKQVGIYSSVGQRYEPEDIGSVLSYREATDGQILEEGISEAGAIASWTAAATSYSVHGVRDAALLHLLLDVRLPARGRPDLGRRRPARARLPARRHLGPHHAGRRRPAAPGRHQPSGGRDHPELQGLRPGVRRRDGGDHRSPACARCWSSSRTSSTTSR